MRFVQVVFLALWQLTAIPFMGLLTAHALKPNAAVATTSNYTVIYKTHGGFH